MNEESDSNQNKKEKKKKKKHKKEKGETKKGEKKKHKKKRKKEESETEAETEAETDAETEAESEITEITLKRRSPKNKRRNSSPERGSKRGSMQERRPSTARELEEENLVLRRSLKEVNRLMGSETNNEEIFVRPRCSSQFQKECIRCCDDDKANNYPSQIILYRIIITVLIGVLGLGTVVFISAGRMNQVMNPTATGVSLKNADGILPCGNSKEQGQNGGVNCRGRSQRDKADCRREQGGNKRKQNGRC